MGEDESLAVRVRGAPDLRRYVAEGGAMLIDGPRLALNDNLPFYEIKQVKYPVRMPLVPPSRDEGGYPAGALPCAVYLASGVGTMERGQVSMDRDPRTG